MIRVLIKQIIIILLIFSIPTALFSQSMSEEKYDVPVYEVGSDEVSLVDFPVYFISDETQSHTVSEIANGDLLGEVISSRYYIPEIKADRWFIFDITNSSNDEVDRIIRIDEAIFDLADLFYMENGKWVHLKGGLDTPINERALKNRTPSFPVKLKPGKKKRIYLKFYSRSFLLTLGVRLESPEKAVLFEQKFLFVYFIFFGGVCALLAYYIFLFLSLRERIYLYYILHGVCNLIWTAFYNGFDFYFHSNLEISNGLLPVVPLVLAFHIMFMRSLMDTQKQMPKLDKFILGSAIYFFIMSFGVFLNENIYHFLALSTPVFTTLLLVVGAYGIIRRVPMAPYYLIASAGNALGGFLLASVCIGAIKYSFWARHGILIGFAMEMIIFALALAYRVKRLVNEKLHYQKEATRIEAEARERLETLVDQRTAELQDSNRKLEELSQTDGLTGLLNRRHFDHCLQREWKRLQRTQGKLSLIIGDIDYFKKYNDHYGHVEGDSCLQRVAQQVMITAGRDSDLSARYGGEEFVVLLPETDLTGARDIANQILAKIINENIPHAKSTFGQVTMSMGVTTCVPSIEKEPSDFVKKADSLLYRAKELGRGQVVAEFDYQHVKIEA